MTKPKVDTRLVEEVKELRGRGRTQEEIAGELGVSQGTISFILRAHGLGGHLVRKPSLFMELRRKVG